MICSHCGKKYEDEFSYCPYCAEPKPSPIQKQSVADKVHNEDKTRWIKSIIVGLLSTPVSVVVGYIISWAIYLFTPQNNMYDVSETIEKYEQIVEGHSSERWLYALAVGAIIGLIHYLSWTLQSRHRKMIDVQFSEDQKSICPVCGSHSIALGRKGYDWNKGYWYRMFNIKGGHYLAGMDSRRVTAHCQNCGHSWLTNEEWLK